MTNEAENKEIEEEDGDLEDEAEDELEQEEDEDINYDETWDSIFVFTIMLLLPSPKDKNKVHFFSINGGGNSTLMFSIWLFYSILIPGWWYFRLLYPWPYFIFCISKKVDYIPNGFTPQSGSVHWSILTRDLHNYIRIDYWLDDKVF